MINRVLPVAGLLAIAAVSSRAEDLAWKFDASARPADITSVSSGETTEGTVSPSVAQSGAAIDLFDSRWEYALLSTGWTFHVPRIFSLILK